MDSDKVPYVFCIKQELRSLHRTFAQPSVKALKMLLRQAHGEDL